MPYFSASSLLFVDFNQIGVQVESWEGEDKAVSEELESKEAMCRMGSRGSNCEL